MKKYENVVVTVVISAVAFCIFTFVMGVVLGTYTKDSYSIFEFAWYMYRQNEIENIRKFGQIAIIFAGVETSLFCFYLDFRGFEA